MSQMKNHLSGLKAPSAAPSSSSAGYSRPDGGQRDEAYRELRRLLILQQIAPGSRLTEAEWAQRLSVNRSALREALVQLEVEGLIVRGPKAGSFVPHLTLDDEREVLIVRFALESTAIDLVCGAGLNTPEGLKRMQDACDLHQHLIDENYHLGSAEADWRFHESLVEAANNTRLAMAYRHAPLCLLHPHVRCGRAWALRSRKTVEEHAAILQTILAGDASKAKRLLRSHLFGYWEEDRKGQKETPGGTETGNGPSSATPSDIGS